MEHNSTKPRHSETDKIEANIIENGQECVTYDEAKFDPDSYVKAFDIPEYQIFFRFIAEALHEVFHSGNIFGEHLIDVGTGPAWYGVFEASRWFREITLSDISETNIALLRHWKDGTSSHGKDKLISYILELDGHNLDLQSASQMVAERVKHVIHLDARKQPFLVDTEVAGVMFDTILLTLCQFNAAHGFDENVKLVQGYSAHQKKGGYVIVIDTIDTSYYTIGNTKYMKVSLPKEKLLAIFETCRYERVFLKESENWYNKDAEDLGLTDVKGAFVLVCKKID